MQTSTIERQAELWGGTMIRAAVILGLAFVVGLLLGRAGVLDGLLSQSAAGETAVAGATPATVSVTAADMGFGSEPIRVKVGQPVTLQLVNDDFYGHSFDVAELGLHQEMPMRGKTAVTFTPEKPGTYQVTCAVPGHTEAGMVTTLIVTP